MADKIIHTGDGGGNTGTGLIAGLLLAVVVIGGLFFFGAFGGGGAKAPAPGPSLNVDVNGR